MSNIVDIEFIGHNAIVSADDVSFTFESAENPRDFKSHRNSVQTLDWTHRSYNVGRYEVFPFGSSDDLPQIIRDVVSNNDSAPGKLKKKTGLLWGKGPKLYQEKIENGRLTRDWKEDREIQAWMEEWDAEGYLMKSCVDYHHIENIATKIYRGKGGRIGRPSIAKLEHMNISQSRKARLLGSNNPMATHCIYSVDQYERDIIQGDYKVYSLFDHKNPFSNSNSVHFSSMPSFISDHYGLPDIFGSLEWLRLSTSIPVIFKAFAKNSINLKYHIISPQMFWDAKKKELETLREEKGETYKEQDLLDFKKDFLAKVQKTLSNKENTGKFWHSVKHFMVEGHNLLEQGWEIKPLDQKIKEFIEGNVKIWETANRALGSGIGFHSSLGGGSENGKSDSGSEQIYAMKNYLLTGIDIPESIVTKTINYAIKANWPDKNLKVGFYHSDPQTESETSPTQRIKNAV